MAGLDMPELAHLTQHGKAYAAKGTLLSAVDAQFGKLDENQREQFLAIVVREVAKRSPEALGTLPSEVQALAGTALPAELDDVLPIYAEDSSIVTFLGWSGKSHPFESR
jgi:hypothetical protein